jgi:oligopeptide/dipeptide ABC transporter ATP-binding protein
MLTMDGNQGDSLQTSSSILEVKNLTITYKFSNYSIKVVNRANIHVMKGEKVGIVGESGSGKTSLATAISGLLDSPPAVHNSGRIFFDGREITPILSPERNKNGVLGLNMVFQEPLTSLNPVYKVRDQLLESMIACGLVKKDDKNSVFQGIDRIKEMLSELSIDSPEKVIEKFPHELSGGMRQRIAIALALLQKPKLVIMDEPTTGLDTIVQVKLLKLLSRMQSETGLSLIIITHDLTVAAQICDRIYVMYAGKIVEYGKTFTIIKSPKHPYTSLLLSSIPSGFYDSPPLPSMRGDPPDMRNIPRGCAFSPRCPFAFDRCQVSEPEIAVLENNQGVACFLYE